MSNSRRRGQPQEIEELIGALREGTIEQTQADRLTELLREDPSARRAYVRQMALHADLSQIMGGAGDRCGSDTGFDSIGSPAIGALDQSPREDLSRLDFRTTAWLSLASAAAALLAMVTLGYFGWHQNKRSTVANQPARSSREEMLVGTDVSPTGAASLKLPVADSMLTSTNGAMFDEIGQQRKL